MFAAPPALAAMMPSGYKLYQCYAKDNSRCLGCFRPYKKQPAHRGRAQQENMSVPQCPGHGFSDKQGVALLMLALVGAGYNAGFYVEVPIKRVPAQNVSRVGKARVAQVCQKGSVEQRARARAHDMARSPAKCRKGSRVLAKSVGQLNATTSTGNGGQFGSHCINLDLVLLRKDGSPFAVEVHGHNHRYRSSVQHLDDLKQDAAKVAGIPLHVVKVWEIDAEPDADVEVTEQRARKRAARPVHTWLHEAQHILDML